MATKTYSVGQPSNVRQIVNIFALGATITINALANILLINGLNSGEISDLYPSLFTPAGYVFSIWSVIYVLLIAFVVFQGLPSQKDNPRLERLGYAFAASCLFNFLWIFAWHYRYIFLSELLIIGVLVSLLVCYHRLQTERVNKREIQVSRLERITTHLTFSIYTGWLTVAVVANTCVLLLRVGLYGWFFRANVGCHYGARCFNNRRSLYLSSQRYGLWARVGLGVCGDCRGTIREYTKCCDNSRYCCGGHVDACLVARPSQSLMQSR
jgi:TspO/MBR family